MGVVDFRRPNWRRYLPPIHFFAPVLKKRKNFPTISGEAINRRTGSEHLLPRVTRSSSGSAYVREHSIEEFYWFINTFCYRSGIRSWIIDRNETKTEKKKKKRKRRWNARDKGTFFLFYSSLSPRNEHERQKKRKKGGGGKRRPLAIAKITESRLFSIQWLPI